MNSKTFRLATLFSASFCLSIEVDAMWDEKLYNPMPATDDIILPMPCDGGMVFRKVFIPLAGPLDDYPIHIGQDGAEMGFIEQSRPAFIAGSFSTTPNDQSRYYLLAKYEMSELQYRAITDPACPTPSNKLRLPSVSHSWFEAVAASDKYNIWLRRNAADKLPKEDGVAGFVRLPTEVEWEFAARGGISTAPAEFRDLHYPMPDGINGYEWFSGAQSSNGQLQLTGLLKPNPLGLHDMLGNVDEMMFEPFRLSKLDRQHGQAGGYLVRGGNYLTPQADVRSALRREETYYNSQGPKKTTGIRFALVSSTLTSRDRVKTIEISWANLGSGEKQPENKEGAVQALGQLASDVEDKGLKDKLKNLEQQLRANNQQQEEARDQAIRASLNLGAFLCTKLLDDGKYVEFLQINYSINCENSAQDPSCPMRKVKLDEQNDRVYKLSRYYASSLVESGTLYTEQQLASQVPVLDEILNSNIQLKELSPYLQTHWKNQHAYLENSKIDVEAWLGNCKSVVKK